MNGNTRDPKCTFCGCLFDPREIHRIKNTRLLVCPRCATTRRQYVDRVETEVRR
jgi:DNA-directed RNA polymerase subunit RPC12/RpoP